MVSLLNFCSTVQQLIDFFLLSLSLSLKDLAVLTAGQVGRPEGKS